MTAAPTTPTTRTTHSWVAEQTRRVRFGVDLGPAPNGSASLEWARLVERLGFDSFWLRDHPTRAPEDPFTYLAAIAAVTSRMRLGTLVACVRFRHPMLLARVAADVDRLSGGRLVLGLGGGWDAREFDQMALELPSPAARVDGVAETIDILRGVWGEQPFTYEGAHFRVKEANVHPGPVQAPRVPILVGGGGERKTFPLIARHADASNIEGHGATGAGSPQELAAKYAVLRRRCQEAGRPYDSVLRSYFRAGVLLAQTERAVQEKVERVLPAGWRSGQVGSQLRGTPAQMIDTLHAYVEAGARYFIFFVTDEESLHLLAERVMPEFTKD